MREIQSNQQEAIESLDIREVEQLGLIALGEKTAVCQECGKRLHGGEHVLVYVFRRCPHAVWLTGQVRCTNHPPDLGALASLGVREYVVSGRVGHCSDHTLQRQWPVLLAPTLEALSPEAGRAVYDVEGATPTDVTDCPLAHATVAEAPAFEYVEGQR